MDFIVCGMPRGGTTVFGQLFNAHEQVFCYFMETGLFRYLDAFGRDRPFPSENLQALEDWLREQLRGTLVEGTKDSRYAKFKRLQKFLKVLDQHGQADPYGPGMRFLDERSFEPFLQDVVDLFRRGLFGHELFEQGLVVLEKHFRNVTERPMLGEKTPDNIFFLDRFHAADPDLKIFCILREPYSTLESMKRRAHHDDRFFDSAFSKEVLGGIADYYQYLRAAYDYSLRARPGSFHVCRFEDLFEDNVSFMESAYRVLGLELTETAAQILPKLHIPTEKKRIKGFCLTEPEYILIQLALGEMLEHFGYQVEINKGTKLTSSELTEGVIPLGGLHLEGDSGKGVSNTWMGKEATLFLFFDKQRSAIRLSMSCYFPAVLGLDKVTLRFSSSDVELAVVEIDTAQNDFQFELPLDKFRHAVASPTIQGAPLTISSSASFAPIAVPGLGLDIRDLSFLIRSCELV